MVAISAWGRSIVLFGLAAAMAGCGESQQANQPAALPPAVTVVKATAEDIRPTFRFTGRIEAVMKVDLRARVDGFVLLGCVRARLPPGRRRTSISAEPPP